MFNLNMNSVNPSTGGGSGGGGPSTGGPSGAPGGGQPPQGPQFNSQYISDLIRKNQKFKRDMKKDIEDCDLEIGMGIRGLPLDGPE